MVPQRHQVHALLPGGRAQIERWLPGFTAEALAAGATLSMPAGIEAWVDEERAVTTPSAILLNATRPFLEAHLRRRALALPDVTATTGAVTPTRRSPPPSPAAPPPTPGSTSARSTPSRTTGGRCCWHGQGMSSAALQASCLSEYLCGHPDLTEPATAFFRLQAARAVLTNLRHRRAPEPALPGPVPARTA
ncbi:hypothetical protein [Symbioplanes lichenis]|uniref:hypothetical protein n=1 Tax=Symbioplanes lichenis TaxID=1629072 RepID=UPI002738DD6B|nr:hypothetical protein [Actinoplanes lichenis]